MAIKGYSAFTKAPALPSNCLMSYQDTCWGKSYLSGQMQSVYSTTPANWANKSFNNNDCFETDIIPMDFKKHC